MEELVKQAKNGNKEAFCELVKESTNRAKPYFYKNYPNASNEALQDAMQVASFKAWKNLPSFKEESTFATWHFNIIRNEVYNILKVEEKIKTHEMPVGDILCPSYIDSDIVEYDRVSSYKGAEVEDDNTPQTILEKKDLSNEYKQLLNEVMTKLNPIHSQIIDIVIKNGKSYKEASSELNIPIGVVMSRVFYARQHAQKLIKLYANRNNISIPYIK